MNKIHLGLIYGGESTEHDVSISSYKSIISNINKDKYDINEYYIDKTGIWYKNKKRVDNLVKDLKTEDIVFPILHGKPYEDGVLQGFFEIIKVPYVGCKLTPSNICMDKVLTKDLLSLHGIEVAKYMHIKYINNNFYWILEADSILLDKEILDLSINTLLNYPVIVKPSRSGSSIGVSKCNDILEVFASLDKAKTYDSKILIEEYIEGKELEVAVLGNINPLVSNPGEIETKDIYSYESKYISKTNTKVNKELDDKTINKIKSTALKIYKVLECNTLSRIDFFLTKDKLILNEVNTMPGFTNISMYPKLMEYQNIDFTSLIDKLIDITLNDKIL